MLAKDIQDLVVQDIFDNHRDFLPGERCYDPKDVYAHFNRPIYIDGVDEEEAILMRSALPKNATSLYLSPLDKGLSGAKVYAARYLFGTNQRSKSFVFKLGEVKKIEEEAQITGSLVSPHIPGVNEPIFRKGVKKALVSQDFAGLSANSNPQSLRLFIRSSRQGAHLVQRLLKDRLGNWYLSHSTGDLKPMNLGFLFDRYLKKAREDVLYPPKWSDLQQWVEELTRIRWTIDSRFIEKLKDQFINTPITTIHGDLHSQNILVDERRECWPIDFAWCRTESSPIIDLVMLECSLKFLAIPRRSNLRVLIKVEKELAEKYLPKNSLGNVPYNDEIRNVLNAVRGVREFALNKLHYTFEDYRKALAMMTYSLATHSALNRPYVLSSLQILSGYL